MMKLVMQHPHPKACQQACLAMVSGRTIGEVIEVAGTDRQMGLMQTQRVVKAFGIRADPVHTIPVAAMAWGGPAQWIGELISKHRTLMCSVFDAIDPNFAHRVVIHEQRIYDPWNGIVSAWPWSRILTYVLPVEGVE